MDWTFALALVAFAAFWAWVIAYGRVKGRGLTREQTARSMRSTADWLVVGAAVAGLGFAVGEASLIAVGLAGVLVQLLLYGVIAASARFMRSGR